MPLPAALLAAKAAPAIARAGFATATRAAASRSQTFASSVSGHLPTGKGIGSLLGSVPSATRWAALSSGLAGPYEGEGRIQFSYGAAPTHTGVAYGVQGVGASEFTEKTVSYGERDLRGTSRTAGYHREASPLPDPDMPLPPPQASQASTPTPITQGTPTVDINANPWKQKQQRTGNDVLFQPLYSDSHERGPSPTTAAGRPLLGRRR